MPVTFTRRKFIKSMIGAFASLGFGISAFPADVLHPSRHPVQGLYRSDTYATSTPFPMSDKPVIPPDEVRFLAAHEVISGDTHRRVAMMTYDDVLDNARLSHLLDVYLEQGIKSSFFIIGIDLENCSATLPRLIREGHDLGCHGWTHDMPFTSLSDENIEGQFAKYFAKVQQIIPGYRVKFLRCPFGARNQHIRDLAAAWGMQHVLWTVESGGEDRNTLNNILKGLQNGSIVLSHASRYYDVTEADVIVRQLIRLDYSLENLSSGMDPQDRWG